MPTTLVAQNGRNISKNIKLIVTGCANTTHVTYKQKLARALKACKKRDKVQAHCEAIARKRYAPKTK